MKKHYLIFFVFFFLFTQKVSAINLETYFSNYYFERSDQDGNNYASWKLDYYTIDDDLAYCIQPGFDEGDDLQEVSFEELGLPDEIQEKMVLTAYYGYLYPGHEHLNYRAATQALLWETVLGNGTKVTYSKNRYGKGEVYDVSKEKEEIQELIFHHYDKPSFEGKDFKAMVGETIVLEDTNDVLKDYTVKSTAFANVKIDGNRVFITPKIKGPIQIIFLKKRPYIKKYKFFYGKDVQNMMTVGNVDVVPALIGIDASYGNIKLQKVDKETGFAQGNATLEGAIYGIYQNDGTLVLKVTTDANGIAEVKDVLPYGEYYVQEIQSSKGYFLDQTKYSFTIRDNQTQTIEVKEEAIKGKISVQKLGETFQIKEGGISYENVPLKDVVYQIRAKEDIVSLDGKHLYYHQDDIVDTITTDVNGIATSKKLPLGDYYLLEVSTSDKHILDEERYSFSLEDTKENKDCSINITRYNHLKKAKIDITKIDATTLEKLSGVSIGIFDEKGTKIYQGVTPESGKIEIELPYGKYYYQELESLSGYVKDTEKHFFTVDNEKSLSFLLKNTQEHIEVPKTLQNKNYFLGFISLFCIISGLGGILYHKKK